MADYTSLQKLSQAVVEDLAATGKAVATAESCTGGWIAKSITDIPGSSAVFGYGLVSYSNGAKEEKPVGMVWFAWAVRDGNNALTDASCEHFSGDRELVRELTVAHALQGILERIES